LVKTSDLVSGLRFQPPPPQPQANTVELIATVIRATGINISSILILNTSNC
jgi:hypothetical protein